MLCQCRTRCQLQHSWLCALMQTLRRRSAMLWVMIMLPHEDKRTSSESAEAPASAEPNSEPETSLSPSAASLAPDSSSDSETSLRLLDCDFAARAFAPAAQVAGGSCCAPYIAKQGCGLGA